MNVPMTLARPVRESYYSTPEVLHFFRLEPPGFDFTLPGAFLAVLSCSLFSFAFFSAAFFTPRILLILCSGVLLVG